MLVIWDLGQGGVFKRTNLVEIAKKQIQGQLLSPPLIYNVNAKGSTILASVETGHIFGFNYKEMNKVLPLLRYHLSE